METQEKNEQNIIENIPNKEEEIKNHEISNLEELLNTEPKQKNNTKFIYIILEVLITLLLIIFSIFTIYNIFNTNIIQGIYIKNINVSNLSTSDAKYKLDNTLQNQLPEEIKLIHNDYEATISLKQIEACFDTKSAVKTAHQIGRNGNIFQNNLCVLSTMFKDVNIEPNIKINKEQLTKNLEEISARFT